MRLLIADDEEYTREGLAEEINWKKLEINEVLQASNGAEALSIAAWFRPDIILTDIRMPKMDGIAFSEQIHKMNPETKIIFISGYMEVDYLKSAIKLSVVDYIEKPVSIDAVYTAVKKAVDGIREKREKIQLMQDQKEYDNQKLAELLTGKGTDWEEILVLCKKRSFPISEKYSCCIIWDWSKTKEGMLLRKQVETIVQRRHMQLLFRNIEDEKYQIILAYTNREEYLLGGLYQEIVGIGSQIHLGIGFEAESLKNLHNSYETAMLAVNSSFYEEGNRIYYVDEAVMEKKTIEPHVYSSFVRLLKENPVELEIWKNEIFEALKSYKYYKKEQIQTFFLSIISAIGKAYPTLKGQYPELEQEKDIESVICKCYRLSELEGYLDKLLCAVQEIYSAKAKYGRLTGDVLRYIDSHYSEVDLSVVQIASAFQLTPAYLNVLFKQETGVTLKQHISALRLEHAKQLLKNEYVKVSEVAQRCGYANANYFAKVFREVMEKSPLEYRNEMVDKKI